MNTPPKSGRLFSDSVVHHPPAGVHLAEIDGASRGNPGPASYGIVLRAPDGGVEWELGKCIGMTTNNVAEYYGLLAALEGAVARGVHRLRVRSDSLLLVRQMEGRYKVRSADLRPLHERAMKAARSLQYFAIEYVPREKNLLADRLANDALDSRDGGVSSQRGKDSLQSAGPGGKSVGAQREMQIPRFAQNDGGVARKSRITARYANGALHPAEHLKLHEGEEVEITIHAGGRKKAVSKTKTDSPLRSE
jgi:probable phosphoglycerate mutase